MGYLIFMGVLFVIAFGVAFVKVPNPLKVAKWIVLSLVILVGGGVGATGAFQYNDAGFCQHIQTVAGTENSVCTLGWYFQGWGKSTAWPHFITVAHTNDTSVSGSSINKPYSIRMSDNWNGDVTQTTRFGIPQGNNQFLKMHNDFRSVARLVSTTLKPAVTQSLDSISNMFSMEEYYAGGQRDQYKNEFRDAVMKGRARVTQLVTYSQAERAGGQAASDLDETQDTSTVGSLQIRKVQMVKVKDADGKFIREPHNYLVYGITVSSAILENLDPDDKFEDQIAERKEAASRRMVAQTKRGEQEEQRLLAIASGETEIAIKQAAARVVQITKTTDAETSKKLALIKARRIQEEARIAKLTSIINLEKAKIDAEAVIVTADADAYEREALLASDNGLGIKVRALVQMNADVMKAFAKRNVPTNVIYTGDNGGSLGADSAIANIAATQMMKNLKALDLNLDVRAPMKR